MKIEHVAIWVMDLEAMRSFYEKYFNGKANEKYCNEAKKFQSYFISFDNGCRLELMNNPEITKERQTYRAQNMGLVHLAFSVNSKEGVNELTGRLRQDGYDVVGEPRTTGDGYYESVILDPEGNIIEIVA